MINWTAVRNTYSGADKDQLYGRHPTPADFILFVVFTCSADKPINCLDTSQYIIVDGETAPEYTPEQVIEAIMTHDGVVCLTPGMTGKIKKILMPEVIEEGMV